MKNIFALALVFLSACSYQFGTRDGGAFNSTISVGNLSVFRSISPGGPYSGALGVAIKFEPKLEFSDEKRTIKFSWSFGDGTVSSEQSPSHAYKAEGVFIVTLTVKDEKGNGVAVSTSAVVTKLLVPLTANAGQDLETEEGTTVNFLGTVGGGDGALTIKWDFGDGTQSSDLSSNLSPSHAYADNGSYTAKLTVTDATGKSFSDTALIKVNNVAPNVSIAPASGTVGQPVLFSASVSDKSSVDTSAPFKYLWNFGDGTPTSTAATPAHTYSVAQTYTVSLTVTDKDSGSRNVTSTVIIGSGTPSPISVSLAAVANINEGGTVNFIGSATGGAAPLSYTWNFGDGTSGTGPTPSHTYNDNGSITATLTVTDSSGTIATASRSFVVSNVAPNVSMPAARSGTVGQPVLFSATVTDASSVDSAAVFKYLWNFGDGTPTSTAASPAHTYSTAQTYTVSLTVTDKDSGSRNVTSTVIIGSGTPSPISVSLAAVANINEGGTVNFIGSATGGAAPLSYTWNFGDGNSGGGSATTSHLYANSGNIIATLSVSDAAGASANASRSFVVNNVAPVVSLANFSGTPNQNIPLIATITEPSPSDMAGLIYSWEFGDGQTSSVANPSHAYTTEGAKTLKLSVRDPDGAVSNTAQATVTISAASAPLAVSVSASGLFFEDAPITFTGNATGGKPPYSYYWSFADGTTSTVASPAHTFADAGSYNVLFTVTDSSGAQSYTTNWTVVGNASPSLGTFPDMIGVIGQPIKFSSANMATYPPEWVTGLLFSWDFGDGSGSTEFRPSHTYSAAGTYTAKFMATISGTVYSESMQVVIAPSSPTQIPSVSIGSVSAISEGGSVTFSGSASGGTPPYMYAWDFGDGQQAGSKLNPSHTYWDSGTFSAKLTVTDSKGVSGSATRSVTVNNVAPTVGIPHPATAILGQSVTLIAGAEDISPMDRVSGYTFAWDFGDGTTGTGGMPTHTYPSVGPFTARVTVTDKDGAVSNQASTTVTIISQPAAPALLPVTNFIQTPWAKIPNFGLNATKTTVANGNWDSPSTWSGGAVPGAGDIVVINKNVTYNVYSDAAIKTVAVQAGGTLQFVTNAKTRLSVINLLVHEGGSLIVGTAANPVAANMTAEIIIPDVPLDAVNDPEQYGNGVIVLGKLQMHGAKLSKTYVRLAKEAKVGDTSLLLSESVNAGSASEASWKAGDKLVLPDSRYLTIDNLNGAGYSEGWETPNIESVSADGKTVVLKTALKVEHPGAYDMEGNLDFLPHVGVATRNVVVKSAAARGTRGYVFVTHRADFDARYVQFQSLGRSKQVNAINDLEANRAFDSAGALVGARDFRNPVTFFHLVGPVVAPQNGYQFTLLGSDVTCFVYNHGIEWGVAVVESSYGLIQNNVIYNWRGAGIALPRGNEIKNVIDGNFIVRIMGDFNHATNIVRADRNDAGEGVGIWLHGFDNRIRNNVLSTMGSSAIIYFATKGDLNFYGASTSPPTPLYQGADPSVAGQSRTVDFMIGPILEHYNNEVYGHMAEGIVLWNLGIYGSGVTLTNNSLPGKPIIPIGESVIRNDKYWHIASIAIFFYPVNKLTLDGIVIRGQWKGFHLNTSGISPGDYYVKDMVLKNFDIQGVECGYQPGVLTSQNSIQVIRDSYMRNHINVNIFGPLSTTTFAEDGLPPVTALVKNVRFGAPMSMATWQTGIVPQPANINMYWAIVEVSFLLTRITTLVEDYNGVPGDNFQTFFHEQDPNFRVKGGYSDVKSAAEVGGLTNYRAWGTKGSAMMGGFAPLDIPTNQRAGINGIVKAR